MEWVTSIIEQCASFLKGHTHFISMSIITTLLMVYGHAINKFFMSLTEKLHIVFRFILFMLLCTIGYAFIATNLASMIRTQLAALPTIPFLITLSVLFLILGILAKRSGEI